MNGELVESCSFQAHFQTDMSFFSSKLSGAEEILYYYFLQQDSVHIIALNIAP